MKRTKLLVSFILLGFLFISSASAQRGMQKKHQHKPWIKIGSQKVNYKMDRDVIRVGPQDGFFKKLKVQITGGTVNMHKVIIEYGNGSKDVIQVRDSFTGGTGSRVIDLPGGNRVIKDITFFYDTKNSSRKKGTVHIFGR